MAIFKVPRITSGERQQIILESAEIVYDTDAKTYYGGDNLTLGGYPLGSGSSLKTEKITLTQDDILNKYILLSSIPTNPMSTFVLPDGGIFQSYGIDFTILGNKLSWEGLGLDNLLEVGETLTISY
jgi:hypothetical protein